jgi:hypothetical protein
MAVPFLEKTIYTSRVFRLSFVIALQAVLFVEGGILSNMLDVD